MAHGCLLTNDKRSRWLNVSPSCSLCANGIESTLHVVHDCPMATQIWLPLVKSVCMTDFFTGSLHDWVHANMSTSMGHCSKEEWRVVFMTGCYYVWVRRNKAVFDPEFIRPNRPHMIIFY